MVPVSSFALLANASVHDAVQIIEQFKKTLAVVVDSQDKVIGTVSDGDVRRYLLSGGRLDDEVRHAMNSNPAKARATDSDEHLLSLIAKRGVEAVPIVDDSGRFQRLVHFREVDTSSEAPRAEGFSGAVIMAGGKGLRLAPLTKTTPKPMIEVGGAPLIGRQIGVLANVGIDRVFVSVHHLRELIEEYLGDGSRFGVSISYLRESEPLGTAGSLSLLPTNVGGPLLVMNGDVLTGSDYSNLLRFHLEHEAFVTVGVVEYVVNIPYGVVVTNGTRVETLKEKPTQRFLCNAGIYVLSDNALAQVPNGISYDMTDLIASGIEEGRAIVPFPIHEYWTDIGTPQELDAAREFVRRNTSG